MSALRKKRYFTYAKEPKMLLSKDKRGKLVGFKFFSPSPFFFYYCHFMTVPLKEQKIFFDTS